MSIQTRSKRVAAENVKETAESAIPGVTIPEVRRGLDALRTSWNTADSPFYFSAPLSVLPPESSGKRKKAEDEPKPVSDTMESFCIKYIMGHHVKRYEKAKHQH